MNINRRTFLKATLGATAGLYLPQWLMSDSHASTAKIREFWFSASRTKINLGTGPDFWAWTFNGQVPGPEIRVKEGEIIRVILKNYLPEETSIHWHGIPLPNPMDGVPGVTQKGVGPGESFVYEFEARPSGTYMYHSHAGYQLDQGLYGPLIIEPARETDSYDREYSLMLEDWVMKDGGGTADTQRRSSGMGMMGRRRSFGSRGGPLLEPVYDNYGVNGKVYSALNPLKVKKGDKVKLRLANPSSSTTYDLSLAGHVMTITHADGNPVKPIKTEILRIGMGERYDVEFVADNPGYWLLAAADNGFGESRLRIPIRYDGIQSQKPTGPVFQRRMRFVSYWDMKSLDYSIMNAPGPIDRSIPQSLSGGMHSPFWTINGQVYPDTRNLNVKEGERIRIGYSNHSMMPHPMHLHGHFFRIVNRSIPPDSWIQKDTVIVNPMESMEIEFNADNPGKWIHHCHNLYHMMAGMANILTVG
ncbi:multicopper oxidase family protein [Thermodesulfobacteriota bacterium]